MLTVCVVEDQTAVRERIAALIAKRDDATCLGQFATGEDALEGLPELQPDVTFMDVSLPGMSGVDCMARLAAEGYERDFIILTTQDSDDVLFRALELGARGYLLKERGLRGVASALQEYRLGGAPMSRRIAQRVLESFRKTPTGRGDGLGGLTRQQRIVLELVAQGRTNKEIALELGITESTVKQHNFRIYRRLDVSTRGEAVRLYHQRT